MELWLSTLKFTDKLNSSYTCQYLKSFLALVKDFLFFWGLSLYHSRVSVREQKISSVKPDVNLTTKRLLFFILGNFLSMALQGEVGVYNYLISMLFICYGLTGDSKLLFISGLILVLSRKSRLCKSGQSRCLASVNKTI